MAGGRSPGRRSSDQPWLTISPGSGTFSGRSIATILVNRGALAPQPYRGHIAFIQQGKTDSPLTLTVSMSVTPAPPASLTVSAVSLSYVSTQINNPTPQPLTLQNTSTRAVDWSSAVITGNGVNWLSISPGSARLGARSSETVMVSVQSQALALGTYEGTIGFKGGTNPVVSVALSVIAPGNLAASPPSLTFAAVGKNPPAQTITLQNSGGEWVAWSVTAATVDGAHWLVAAPTSGSVGPGGSATVSVSVSAASLAPRSYQGALAFIYNGVTRQVPVSLTVSVPPGAGHWIEPAIPQLRDAAQYQPGGAILHDHRYRQRGSALGDGGGANRRGLCLSFASIRQPQSCAERHHHRYAWRYRLQRGDAQDDHYYL